MGRAVFKILSVENFEININLIFKCLQTPVLGSCVSFEGNPVTHKATRNLARFGELQMARSYLPS